MTEESEFILVSRIIEKLKDEYYKQLEESGWDGAYFPIRITVWEVDTETFKPFKKLVEIDDRES